MSTIPFLSMVGMLIFTVYVYNAIDLSYLRALRPSPLQLAGGFGPSRNSRNALNWENVRLRQGTRAGEKIDAEEDLVAQLVATRAIVGGFRGFTWPSH